MVMGVKKSEIDSIPLDGVSAILFLGGKKKASKLSSLNMEMSELDKGIFVFKGGFIQVLIIEIDNVELSRNFSGLKIFNLNKFVIDLVVIYHVFDRSHLLLFGLLGMVMYITHLFLGKILIDISKIKLLSEKIANIELQSDDQGDQ